MTASEPRSPLPPLPPQPSVSVVIPARAAPHTIAAAVESALGQEVPGTLDVVVAVPADDAATRGALEATDPARVRVVDNPGGRTPDALNAAVAATSADVIVRLDAHATLPPRYIATALEVLGSEAAIANVGGVQHPVADPGFATSVAAAMRSPIGSGGAAYRGRADAGSVDTVYLGVFRRHALEAVGGFDTRFERNQDYELNVRLRERGWIVWYDPRLVVNYRPRESPGALWRQYLGYGRWRRATVREHPASLRLRQLAPPALVLTLLAGVSLSVATGSVLPVALPIIIEATVVGFAGLAADAMRAPSVAGALIVMHLAWGIGFLLGPPRGWRR